MKKGVIEEKVTADPRVTARKKRRIIGSIMDCVVAIFFILIASIIALVLDAYDWLPLRRHGPFVKTVQKAYTRIETVDDQERFVLKYGNEHLYRLPYVVMMSLGDAHLANGNYERAKENYEKIVEFLKRGTIFPSHETYHMIALSIGDAFWDEAYDKIEIDGKKLSRTLERIILFPRAKIVQAIAEYKLGNFLYSESILHDVACNKNFDKAMRGQAAYVLIAMLKDHGDNAKAAAFAKKISAFQLTPALVSEIYHILGAN